MSTTINVTVDDGGLPAKNRQQTAANRQAFVQGKASQQAAQQGADQRAADRRAAGLDPATGRPLTSAGASSRLPRITQEPAANRATAIKLGWHFYEENFLDVNGPGVVQYYTQFFKELVPEAEGVPIEDINSKAIKLTDDPSKVKYSLARVDWETSSNCGGSNSLVQSAYMTAAVKTSRPIFLAVRIEGVGELQDLAFENLNFFYFGAPNGARTRLDPEAFSAGGGLQCAAGPVLFYPEMFSSTDLYTWAPFQGYAIMNILFTRPVNNFIPRLSIEMSTRDGNYHLNCFYKLNFKLSNTPVIDWP
jgi:hypothetical protein